MHDSDNLGEKKNEEEDTEATSPPHSNAQTAQIEAKRPSRPPLVTLLAPTMPPRGSLPLSVSAVVLAGASLVVQPASGLSGPARPSSWQRRLDKALLDVDLAPQARVRNFQRALKDPDLPVDVSIAIRAIRRDGFGKGHPEFINTLWPVGTTARSDLEGITALTAQLPEAIQELRGQVPDLIRSSRDQRSRGGRAPPRAQAPALDAFPKPDEIKEELKNALRSTPKGLEAPKHTVVRTIDGELKLGTPEKIEIRRYEAFKVATAPSMGGVGFNSLASYLFGANEEKEVMAMTMPVLVTRTASDGEGNEEGAGRMGTMKFVLPSSVTEAPPTPLEGDEVEIEQVPERLVAIKSFPGLVTEEEISRQKEALLSVLKGAGVRVANEAEVSVLQYNSPLTLPWRRRNEIALVVEEGEIGSEVPGEDSALEGWKSRPSAASWYDAGVRL